MPLVIPNLDDRTYDDLVREEKAKAKRAPRRKPQPKTAPRAAVAEEQVKVSDISMVLLEAIEGIPTRAATAAMAPGLRPAEPTG